MGKVILGIGVELFDAHDGDVLRAGAAARFQQLVEHLAAAQHQPRHLGRVQIVHFRQHRMELAVVELLQCGDRLLVPQQALRRQRHQGLAQGPDGLAAQHVKDLGGGTGYANLHVVLCAELQIAFQPCG